MSSDKWTQESWNTMNLAELYEGTEEITQPPATALLTQAKVIDPNATGEGIEILDNGAGLGQLTEMLYAGVKVQEWKGKVTLGDVDVSLLEASKQKVEKQGWKGAEVKKLDTTAFDVPDNTYTHVLSNFVYFFLPNAVKALEETLRVTKPGGTIGFTTWAHSGPFYLLQQAQTLIPDAPNVRTIEATNMMAANGYWYDRTFIRDTLAKVGFVNVEINALNYRHTSKHNAKEFAKAMRPVVKLWTGRWADPAKGGWEMFKRIEEVLQAEFGDKPVGVWSVALIVTAKKPVA